MTLKKISLPKLFLIFAIVEVILLILSGNFSKKLEIGFIDSKFVFRNVEMHFDLQEKISEEFMRDEFIKDAAIINSHQIKDTNKFILLIRTHEHQILEKLWEKLDPQVQTTIISSAEKMDHHKLNLITQDIMRVMKEKTLYENDFLPVLLQSKNVNSLEKEPELNDLITSFEKSENSELINMTEREILRLNRLLLEAVISNDILARQEIEPRIYGSYKLYRHFAKFFGEAHAVSAFFLLRILFLVDIVLLLLAFLTKRLLFDRPSKPQLMFEMIYNVFEDFVRDTLGKDKIHFTPYIVTLFLFLWTCNMIGLIPIPGFMEPTRNLNVPLGLGLFVVSVVQITAIKAKGFWGHFSNYVNPIKNPLCLLDIVGELSKIVSISFRLFGNILGGAIIIIVVSSLVKYIVFPVGLNLFFGIFVGTIQAFVFTMLALTYIGVEISE